MAEFSLFPSLLPDEPVYEIEPNEVNEIFTDWIHMRRAVSQLREDSDIPINGHDSTKPEVLTYFAANFSEQELVELAEQTA